MAAISEATHYPHDPLARPAPGEDLQANLFSQLHRLLRGRYAIAIPIVAACALGGGLFGYLRGGPLYTSTGVIRVRPSLPMILYSSERSTAPFGTSFQSFVATQAALLMTDRVLRMALESDGLPPEVVALGVPGIARTLEIKTDRKAVELITVQATMTDPLFAQAIVAATLDAYIDLYGDETRIDQQTVNALEALRQEKEADIRSSKSQIQTLAMPWGTDDLEPLYSAMLHRLDTSIEDQRIEESRLISLQSDLENQLEIENSIGDIDLISIDKIVEQFSPSPRLSALMMERTNLLAEQRQLLAAGALENHVSYRRVLTALQRIEPQIREQARSLIAEKTGSESVRDLIDLSEARIVRLEERITAARDETAKIGRTLSDIREYELDLEAYRSDLERVNDRLEVIQVESRVVAFFEDAERVSVLADPTYSPLPSGDTRRKYAAAGFLGGGGLSFLLFLGLGVLDRRVRFSDDIGKAELALPPLLTVLPRWQDRNGYLLRYEIANAIHRLRLMLESRSGFDEHQVITVTAAVPGEGKTSVALALALSYAHSDRQVLLVDLDLVGRSLTDQVAVSSASGISHAMKHDESLNSVQPTRIPNLSLIGAVPEDEHFAARLTPETVHNFLMSLREQFDVVLVDTGPILGCFETSISCSEADKVVLVVGRGTPQRLVHQATQSIREAGANLAGIVFNNATSSDFAQSPASQSKSSRSQSDRTPMREVSRSDRWCPELPGAPLAEALASTLEAVEEDDYPGGNGRASFETP